MNAHKFYLFEGVDGSGKSSVAKAFSEYIDAQYYHSPPAVLEKIRLEINDNCSPRARYQYYLAGNYITSDEIETLLENGPVVMDKYIYSTIAFHNVLLEENLPLPSDLVMPDHVVYLRANKDVIKIRLDSRNKQSKYEDIEYLSAVEPEYERIFNNIEHISIDTSKLTIDDSLRILTEIIFDV